MTRFLLGLFLLLHSPAGTPLYVAWREVVAVTAPQPRMSGPGIGANILAHDTWFAVRETPEQIVSAADHEGK